MAGPVSMTLLCVTVLATCFALPPPPHLYPASTPPVCVCVCVCVCVLVCIYVCIWTCQVGGLEAARRIREVEREMAEECNGKDGAVVGVGVGAVQRVTQ